MSDVGGCRAAFLPQCERRERPLITKTLAQRASQIQDQNFLGGLDKLISNEYNLDHIYDQREPGTKHHREFWKPLTT
mgnify:CR=1 FL=1